LNGLDGRVTAIEAKQVEDDGTSPLTGTWDASAATWSNLGAVTTVDINGGSIDGTIIGAAAAAAGTFAALVGTTFNATGAATFESTVLLAADPTLDLQAATKQYVDEAPTITEFINGLKLANNTTDADHDIDVAAGSCSDGGHTKVMTLAAGLIKQIDAVWVVGTNVGGLDTGTASNNTWYHCWLIMRSDTGVVDFLFSLSATAPTMPTNYDYKRRIGSVFYENPGNIRAFWQRSDKFIWDVPVTSFDDTNPAVDTAETRIMDVPIGLEVYVEALFNLDGQGSGSNDAVLVTALIQTDTQPAYAGPFTVVNNGNDESNTTLAVVLTDTAASIRTRSLIGTSSRDFMGITLGWIDPRGRDL
jgi:hypothetical protein